MYASFEIASSIKPYKVTIENNSFGKLFASDKRTVILCDDFFSPVLRSKGLPIVAIPASEESKSLESMPGVILEMRKLAMTRNSEVIAVGGGCVQDVATFCCSIYMRGVIWRYMPSTLLGMVDSCIGGKSAINVGQYKNLVGNFYPPQEVIIDPSLAGSLSVEQRVAGLCEAAKITFARGQDAFYQYLALSPRADMDGAALVRLLELSLRSKKWFIEIDEFDKRERLLLNFGHTFGHAIEGAGRFSIAHGVAVGLGMLAALDFAQYALGITKHATQVVALQEHISHLLRQVEGLSATANKLNFDELLAHFDSDKKHEATAYTIISVNSRGELERYQISKDADNRDALRRSFESALLMLE